MPSWVCCLSGRHKARCDGPSAMVVRTEDGRWLVAGEADRHVYGHCRIEGHGIILYGVSRINMREQEIRQSPWWEHPSTPGLLSQQEEAVWNGVN